MIAYDAVLFDLYGTLIDDVGAPIAGVHVLLRGLQGARWGIVTSCPLRLAVSLVSAAELPHPKLLVTADDVERTKPAPDGYRLGAQRLGVEPGRVLVIEDSRHGIAAGRAAGMDVVAILRGRSPEFARAATFVVGELSGLRLRASAARLELDV